ncbi:MAG: tetratricopeptide repeat protein, partial [Longimicrobiales bacterium]|nr:tetratricopeptide repeat protein [Longimicrobiales bacterium]
DQDFETAAEELDEVRGRYGYDTIPPANVPYPLLAHAYARLGAPDRAREVLAAYRREIPQQRREAAGSLASVARALVAMQEGRLEDAEAALNEAGRRSFCEFCRLPVHGMLAERSGDPDEAVRLYTRYLEQPWLFRTDDDAQHKVFVILRLADLHEQLGNRTEAVRYYREFIDLWEDADPELQPRVDAARRALERLAAEGG